jgi:hypothetical protein
MTCAALWRIKHKSNLLILQRNRHASKTAKK